MVAIRGVPKWTELYTPVLRLAYKLSHLSDESLKVLEDEGSMYNAGWSHGKEKLGDTPDFAKGSFYFNPLADAPGTEADRKEFPWALPCNRWPKELPELETAAKQLGKTMHEVCTHLAALVDRTMAVRVPGYNANLGTVVRETQKCKGRLLYYFPPKEAAVDSKDVPEDGWIGWHNDSGFLTALTPDMYVDHDTGEFVANPDPEGAGLYVVTRTGEAVHVTIPPDCMAVQVGECTQVVTGGELVATPHCVRGCGAGTTNGRRIARISCPCFVDTHPTFPLKLPPGADREQMLAKGLSNKVPPLGERWADGQTFGDFLGSTFRRYYDWTLSKAAK